MNQHTVFIPSLHQDLTGGVEQIEVEGASVREVIDALDAQYPGLRDRLVEDGRVKPSIAVAIDGTITHRGLREKLAGSSEVHFIPALSGGTNLHHQSLSELDGEYNGDPWLRFAGE